MENNKYNTLNNLEELLLEEEIKDENGVVSAYTVYKALKRYFDNVFFNAYDNYSLVSKINSLYSNKEIRDSRRKGFESPYLKVIDIKSNVFNINRTRDEIQITFIPFGPENRGYTPRKNVLYKKKNDESIYTKYDDMPTLCDKMWKEYHEDIENIFDICEKHDKLKWFFNYGNSQYALSFKYNDIMVIISFNYFGNISYKIVLNDELKEISTKDYLNIKNLINDNAKELMMRIPINIEELSLIFQKIIDEDLVKRGKVRERKK